MVLNFNPDELTTKHFTDYNVPYYHGGIEYIMFTSYIKIRGHWNHDQIDMK